MGVSIQNMETWMIGEIDTIIDDYGMNVTLRHYTGMKPASNYDEDYNSMNTDYEPDNWEYSESTIKVIFQYKELQARQERELVATAGSMIQRTAFLYCKGTVTIEQDDEIIYNNESFKVEVVVTYPITTSTIYKRCKITKTVDVRS